MAVVKMFERQKIQEYNQSELLMGGNKSQEEQVQDVKGENSK